MRRATRPFAILLDEFHGIHARIEGVEGSLEDMRADMARLEGVSRDCAKALESVSKLDIQGHMHERQLEQEGFLGSLRTDRWKRWRQDGAKLGELQREVELQVAVANWTGCRQCWTDPCACNLKRVT